MKTSLITRFMIALGAVIMQFPVFHAQAQQPCVAAFQYSVGPPSPGGTVISFYDSSWTAGTITNWSWNFSTGQTSNLQNPVITVSGSNAIMACLTITAIYQNQTCTSTWCDTVYLSVLPPVCDANFIASVFQQMATFTATGINNVSWQWSFGDGTGGTGANATHSYASPGTYQVCLTVVDANGTTCNSCQFVTVAGGSGCNAMFTATTVPGSTLVSFIDQSSGNPTNYYWSFGDGGTSTLQNPTHAYNGNGPFLVCLTITDSAQGCTDTYCDSLFLNNGSGCQAFFTASTNPVGNTVSFTNGSTPANATYLWNFGDGTTSTLANPTHTYANPGVYTVCLTVSSGFLGCSDTYCGVVTVGSGSNCQASFTWVADSTGGVQFTNTSTGNPTNYTWTFSNGTTSSLQNPYVQFSSPGWYGVCLSIWTVNGTCQSTWCDSVYVNTTSGGGCSSNFAIYPDTVVAHNYFAINLATGVGPITYLWSWGDGTSSTGAYPSHTYAGPGLYTICLTITDATGCTSTTCYQWQLLRLSSAVPVTINVVPGSTGVPNDPFETSFSVYPNPATDILYAGFSLEQNSDVTVKLFNLAGQTALEVVSTSFGPGSHKLKLDTSNLPKGLYLLQVEAEGSVAQSKVLIQ